MMFPVAYFYVVTDSEADLKCRELIGSSCSIYIEGFNRKGNMKLIHVVDGLAQYALIADVEIND